MPARIEVAHLSKAYRRQPQRATSLKVAMIEALRTFGRPARPTFEALADLSFQVAEGEAVAVLGGNGSGKSTLLKLLAGIIKPTSGSAVVHGRLSPLLELGAGFIPDFTGRENVYLNGALLGLSRRQIRAAFDDIVAFAELASFIDQPIRTYSSGMAMRLGFAIAIHADPDVLLADEVLSVGDRAFQQKCLSRVQALKRQGKAILLVSHDHDTVRALCDRALWLDRGRLAADGPVAEVLAAYEASEALLPR